MTESAVYRVYVEKKPGFDTQAAALLFELREVLGVTRLSGLRLFHRYDVQGLDEEEMKQAHFSVFAERNADALYREELPETDGRLLAVAYQDGQFDQRADSAEKCLQLQTGRRDALVLTARVYAFFGDLQQEDVVALRRYLINEVDSREMGMEKPITLRRSWQSPPDVPVVSGFIRAEEGQLEAWRKEWGLAMSAADILLCRDYFRQEGRDPSFTEIRVLDTYWSDHCRHTTFLTELVDIQLPWMKGGREEAAYAREVESTLAEYRRAREEIYGAAPKRPECLMDMALMPPKQLKKMGKLQDLDESEEINACSIRRTIPVTLPDGSGTEQDYLVMFKNETHNHPTEIEPFGGAATCLGGAIRDPLSGRSYVYQALRVTGSGDPTAPVAQTVPGKLPQRKISIDAAAGFSSYGNQIGLQTGHVEEVYHPGYVAKRMEIGAVVGAVPADYVRRERPTAGDLVVLLGGRTGRDGCGGATGSSKAHDSRSLESCGAEVQKGNPPTERAIARLFRKPEVTKLILRCNDFGAGGVSVAIGELADGLTIDLDAVPKKYEGLDGTELAISESQERMACVVDEKDAQRFIALANEENLEATVVAIVNTNEEDSSKNRLRMTWRGEPIVDISRDFLDTNGATAQARAALGQPEWEKDYFLRHHGEKGSGIQKLKARLGDLNGCSQRGLTECFDGSIGTNNLLQPFGGLTGEGPSQAMAAVIPLPEGQTTACTLMAHGFDPHLSEWSPYHGASYAVLESLAKIAAMGGDALSSRLSFQEYFQRLEDIPQRWGQPVSALLGAYRAQMEMGTAAIGGKDSMSGSFGEMHVPPTLVSFALDVGDARRILGNDFTRAGAEIALLPLGRDESELPDYARARANYAALYKWIGEGKVTAARAVGRGGAAAAAAYASFGNEIGCALEANEKIDLFAPDFGSILLELAEGVGAEELGEGALALGHTLSRAALLLDGEEISLSELKACWRTPLDGVFPVAAAGLEEGIPTLDFVERARSLTIGAKIARPRVLVPVFPGSNCEYDSRHAFERAGANVEECVLRNLSPAALEESISSLVKGIENAQIVFLPGGFSMGDEPEGSAKFIAAVFRSGPVRDATMKLLSERDGLMIGICNGFQALVKLGLLPYGEIRDLTEEDPTLTYNRIGRHVARYVHTRVASVHSPWLSGVESGQVHAIPVSHGEGRFVANGQRLQALAQSGQIAFQYCDRQGNPACTEPENPNGSTWAIEGILSPDGRILGKMGHSERVGTLLAKNVPGEKDQELFASGVGYFK